MDYEAVGVVLFNRVKNKLELLVKQGGAGGLIF